MDRPWSLTLRQFFERVERAFGGQRQSFFMIGAHGRRIDITAVVRDNPARYFAALLGVDEDEPLTSTLIRSLCVQLGIPPDIVGLEPEEPHDPDQTS